jgi:N-acetylglucosamine malate deacetylase 1
MNRVLAIGAHPDDVEFLCAGTLALLRERGWEISIASMTPGDCGSTTLSREEISRVRREEARRAAAILDAGYECLESSDFCVIHGEELMRRVTGLIRRVDPTLVFTHSPVDYIADHEETAKIVGFSCFAAPVPNYETGDAPTAAIPHLYYCDPAEFTDHFGKPIEPELVVDITDTLETKERMLACHESQREWLRAHHGCDQYLDQMRAWVLERGGEGFRQHRGHAYPKTDLLHETLRVPR